MEQLMKCRDKIEAGLSYRNSGDWEDIGNGGKLSGSVYRINVIGRNTHI